MKVIGMIPVRLESSRLPEKALCDILGLPMIIHTLKRTQLSKTLDEVYVVTDSEVIKELVESYQGRVIMTSKTHKTGSDRLAEAAEHIEADIVVNIQGDEALVDPENIDAGVRGLVNSKAEISILLTQFSKKQSYDDIKAVVNLKNEIMYFSRNDIPSESRSPVEYSLKAYHVVSFRKDFLIKYSKLERTPLEKIEYNEYLRVLESGYAIQGVMVDSDAVSVDSDEDLKYVRKLMPADKLFQIYKP